MLSFSFPSMRAYVSHLFYAPWLRGVLGSPLHISCWEIFDRNEIREEAMLTA